MLVAIPTAIPPAPLTSKLGNWEVGMLDSNRNYIGDAQVDMFQQFEHVRTSWERLGSWKKLGNVVKLAKFKRWEVGKAERR